jgi:hypothetical protein
MLDHAQMNKGDSSPLSFFYINAHSSKNRVQEILASNKWDIVFISESPWYQISRNHKTSSADDFTVMGTTANSAYQLFTACSNPKKRCYVSAYVHTKIMRSTTVNQRLDTYDNDCILSIDINDVNYTLVYNKPQFKGKPMKDLCGRAWARIDKPRVLVGDFNLHSPMWDAATINTTREAQSFVD